MLNVAPSYYIYCSLLGNRLLARIAVDGSTTFPYLRDLAAVVVVVVTSVAVALTVAVAPIVSFTIPMGKI